MSASDPYAEFKDAKSVVGAAPNASVASPYDEFKDPIAPPTISAPPTSTPAASATSASATIPAPPPLQSTQQFDTSIPFHQLESRRRDLIEKPTKEMDEGIKSKYRIQEEEAKSKLELEKQKQNNDAQMARLDKEINAGRYQKPAKTFRRVDLDEEGNAVEKVTGLDINGNLLWEHELGPALPKNVGKPKPAFYQEPDGTYTSVLLNPLTNQLIPNSENKKVVPPAAYLTRITQREGIMITTNPDGTMTTSTVPLTTIRGIAAPGGGVTGMGTQRTPNVQGGAGAPATPPHMVGAPETNGIITPELIKFIQDQNKANHLTPEVVTEALQNSGYKLPGAGVTGSAPAQAPTPTSPTPTAGGNLQGRALPNQFPPGFVNQSVQRAIPIREAYTQMVGSPDFPDMPSLMSFARIADDPVRSRKLAKAVRLTVNGLEDQEKVHGSLINLLKLYSGVPSAMVAAQVDTYRELVGDILKDDPELQRAYTSEMATISQAVALRALSKAGVAQASVKKLENEVPIIGENATSSRAVYGMLSPMVLEAYNGAISTPTMPPREISYLKDKIAELNRLAKGSAIPPPPGGRGAAPNAAPAGTVRMTGPGGTFDVPKAKQPTFEQNGYSVVTGTK